MKVKRIIIASLASILVIAGIQAAYAVASNSGAKKPFRLVAIDPKAYYKVTSVIDGDTFEADIGGKPITVRVLGINTPETVDPRKPVECYGKEASNEAKELLAGRKVRLEANPGREPLDKYRRYLLYVYRDDGMFYNESMIEHGFAREYTFNGEKYEFQGRFRKAEEEAKSQKLGLWKECE